MTITLILWVVVVLWVAFIIFLHCVRKKPIDTQTGSSNRTGYGTRTENGSITGNGNRTIRNFDEFNLPVPSPQPIIPRVTISSDSNRRSVFEGNNLSTHFLTLIGMTLKFTLKHEGWYFYLLCNYTVWTFSSNSMCLPSWRNG